MRGNKIKDRTYFCHSHLHFYLFSPYLYQHSFTVVFLHPTFPYASFLRPQLFPVSLATIFSPPLHFHASAVSPVYEGKFIGLPGAVSWRWPPLLKPQQGITLHTEQTQKSERTALFPPPHNHTCWCTHTSHYLLMSILLALPFESCLVPSCSWTLVGWFFPLYIAPSSICFLLVYKEQLVSGGLHVLTSACVALFLTHRCYKSVLSVHSYIIYVVCPPYCTFVLLYT